MGLFRKKLQDIEKIIDQGHFESAYGVLKEHFDAEHTLEGDLAGLAAAIHSYQQHLVKLKERLAALKSWKPLARLDQHTVKGIQQKHVEDIRLIITAAREEVVKIQALIGKMRVDARIKLP